MGCELGDTLLKLKKKKKNFLDQMKTVIYNTGCLKLCYSEIHRLSNVI
jgi:hypothetical protein